MSPPSALLVPPAADGTREKVHDLVNDAPGATIAAVAEALGLDHSTVAYHLRKLERSGLVSSQIVGREKRHYPSGHPLCPFLRAASGALTTPACREAFAAVAREPWRRVSDVARETGQAVPSARWALERLESSGLVARLPGGRIVVPEEVRPCTPHALALTRCGLWGRCAVSRSEWAKGLVSKQAARSGRVEGEVRGAW